MKYYVNEKEVSEQEFRDELENSIRTEVEEHYDDMLDELYPEVQIGFSTFYASQILKECDPIAYNLGMDDFINADLEAALNDFEDEYETSFGCNTFKTEDEPDE